MDHGIGKSGHMLKLAEEQGTPVMEIRVNQEPISYRIKNGSAYHFETPLEVVNIIEEARLSDRDVRLRFCFGDVKSGHDWGETCDTTGYIGRSTGTFKIPLLIKKIDSTGGGGILDHCIVRIERKERGDRSYREVYRHPKYHR